MKCNKWWKRFSKVDCQNIRKHLTDKITSVMKDYNRIQTENDYLSLKLIE